MAAKAAAAAGAVRSILAAAQGQAARLQSLLLIARRFAAAAQQGARPQRRRGAGGDFWQFRPYQPGEDAAAIDWRRSARDESQLYIRDKERESSQTIAIAPDLSASMLYRSPAALASKEERALLWLFVLAELAAANGDKVEVPGLLPPRLDRQIGETIAAALLRRPAYPPAGGLSGDFAALPRFANIILISDFLDEPARLAAVLRQLAEREAQISLIRLADPAERNFPFAGDMLLQDPESGAERYFGQAQMLRRRYQQIYGGHMAAVEELARRYQAQLMVDMTDTPPEQHLAELAKLLRHD